MICAAPFSRVYEQWTIHTSLFFPFFFLHQGVGRCHAPFALIGFYPTENLKLQELYTLTPNTDNMLYRQRTVNLYPTGFNPNHLSVTPALGNTIKKDM